MKKIIVMIITVIFILTSCGYKTHYVKNITNELLFVLDKESKKELIVHFNQDITSYYLVQKIEDEFVSHEHEFYYIIDYDNSIFEYLKDEIPTFATMDVDYDNSTPLCKELCYKTNDDINIYLFYDFVQKIKFERKEYTNKYICLRV